MLYAARRRLRALWRRVGEGAPFERSLIGTQAGRFLYFIVGWNAVLFTFAYTVYRRVDEVTGEVRWEKPKELQGITTFSFNKRRPKDATPDSDNPL
jgi:hypothetical protein